MSNADVSSVFDAFVQAKEALEKLPAVTKALDETTKALAASEAEITGLHSTVDEAQAKIAELTSALAAKEAALSDATFRETEIRNQHTSLRSILADKLGLVDPPKPEPVAEAPQEQSVEQHIQDTSGNGSFYYVDHTAPVVKGLGPMPDEAQPALAPLMAEQASLAQQTDSHATSSAASGEAPATQSTETDGTDKEVANPATVGELATAAATQSNATTAPAPATPDAGGNSQPFTGLTYNHKPETMTWTEWTDKGGDAAPWLSYLRAAS